jgi:hypothetical protein
MILILADSLRNDFATKYLKGIWKEESWGEFNAVETFTAPVLASVFTGQPPEVTGMKGEALIDAFTRGLPEEACKDTLFNHFDSWVTISRLIGNGPKWRPPSRRDEFKFLPPIDWHAETNNDDDVLEYVGRKWSLATKDWYDLIFYHCWLTHGPWGIDCYGPKELPCVVNCDRLMARMPKDELLKWYKIGVDDFITRLRAFDNMTNGLETILVFADHGENLQDSDDGQAGHYAGSNLEALRKVPIWCNRKDVDLSNITHMKIKDLCIQLYEKYEKNNPEYLKWKHMKEAIQTTKGHEKTLDSLASK